MTASIIRICLTRRNRMRSTVVVVVVVVVGTYVEREQSVSHYR